MGMCWMRQIPPELERGKTAASVQPYELLVILVKNCFGQCELIAALALNVCSRVCSLPIGLVLDGVPLGNSARLPPAPRAAFCQQVSQRLVIHLNVGGFESIFPALLSQTSHILQDLQSAGGGSTRV